LQSIENVGCGGEMTTSLAPIFRHLWFNATGVDDASLRLLRLVERANAEFRLMQQQDAQVFVCCFLFTL
jgi:hypothetical protein